MKEKVVVLCSGGMDSVTVLGLTVNLNYEPFTLFLNYNQKTAVREAESAKIASTRLGAHFKEVRIDAIKELTNTSLIHDSGETEVQGRNAILISLATSYAQTIGAKKVFIGIQSQDVPYKDAHKEFLTHINNAMKFAYNIEIVAPLIDKSKVEILKIAKNLNIDLNMTYSCYFDAQEPCGECPSCLVRKSAELEFNKETY